MIKIQKILKNTDLSDHEKVQEMKKQLNIDEDRDFEESFIWPFNPLFNEDFKKGVTPERHYFRNIKRDHLFRNKI